METKIRKAIVDFLKHQGMAIVNEDYLGWVVFTDEDELVFAKPSSQFKKFEEHSGLEFRNEFEMVITNYLIDHDDYFGAIRGDTIDLAIVSTDRATLRWHKDAVNDGR